MSALTNLHTARALRAASNGEPEETTIKLASPRSLGVVTQDRFSSQPILHSIDIEVQMAQLLHKDRSKGKLREYTSALGVLENVNLAFADLMAKVEESESVRDELVAECDSQDQKIQQLHHELATAKDRCDAVEKLNAELSDRLLQENKQVSSWKLKASQAESLMMETQQRVDDLEGVCNTLHDGIHAVFGVDSAVQTVMTSLGRNPVSSHPRGAEVG